MNKIILAIALSFWTIVAQATLIANGGFETGNLSNWTANNSLVNVVNSQVVSTAGSLFTGPTAFTAVTPTEGNYFAVITAGSPTTTLTSSDFFVNAGESVKFDWFFSAEDYLPFNDFGSYSLEFLVADTVVSANILSLVSLVGDYGFTGWQNFSYNSPLSGEFELKFSSVNVGDKNLASKLGVDNVSITNVNTVPEPGIVLLIGLGLIAFGFSQKRTLAAQLPVKS